MNGHPTHEEDFELYALGALDGEERRALELHLAGCPDCAKKLSEARGRISLLAFAAPASAPSAAVKQRLMSQIRSGTAVEANEAAWKIAAPRLPEAQPPVSPFTLWWNRVLIPVGAALAVATLFLWHENRVLGRQLAAIHSSLDQQERQLADAQDMVALLSATQTITVRLAQQPGQPAGVARVTYNARSGVLMYDGEVAPAPAGKSYQLWLVPAQGDPINAGVFNPLPGQPNHWIAKVPPGTTPKAFAVTLEPAGGVAQPTGPKVLVGPVS